MVSLLCRDDGRIRREHKVDSGIRHQVGLELGDIHIQGTIESEGGSERGDDLGQEPVQIRVGGAFNVQIAAADVVQCFVVVHDGDVGVFEQRMHAENCVVWFHHSSGNLRAGPDCEAELALLAIINGEALQHQATQTRASSATAGIVHHEALKASAIVGELADPVQHEVDDLLTNGVVTPGEVVCCVFLSGDQLLWVEELTVSAGANFIDDSGFQVNEDRARDVLASTSLREESVESVVATTNGFVRWHLAIRLDSMFQAEKLPAGIADLNASLTDVNADGLTHGVEC
mmetsp:Transcript_68980/g.144018  ORF Transcript_68980/g.144018 Transcript_68980/m.144018 type:complete len:288 (-) Transcript_68980:66-929(-)